MLLCSIPIFIQAFSSAYQTETERREKQRDLNKRRDTWQQFCQTQLARHPPHYHPLYQSLTAPVDVYLRYGTADTPAIKKQRERKDIQVAYYWHYYNIHYPLIRCLEAEAENKKLHKFVPTTYCPNYQEDIAADAPDSPQSRYHLVVGEDDAASVISETVVARDEWRNNTKQTLELHTVRL